MKSYWAIRKNEAQIHAATWMNFQNSVRSTTTVQNMVWLHLHEIFRTGKSTQTESRLVDAYGGDSCRQMGSDKIDMEFVQGDENVWKLIMAIAAYICEYSKAIELFILKG